MTPKTSIKGMVTSHDRVWDSERRWWTRRELLAIRYEEIAYRARVRGDIELAMAATESADQVRRGECDETPD